MSGRVYIFRGLLFFALISRVSSLEPGKKYNFRFKDGQHLRNAVLLEETKTSYRVRLDYILEEKILEKKDLKDAPLLAHSFTAMPATGSLLPGIKKVTLTFAEPVSGAENPENYGLTGDAVGTLKVEGIKPSGKDRYEVSFSGEAADGDLTIRLTNITDNVGAPLMGDAILYRLDATPPRVGAQPENKSPVRNLNEVALRYSEPVKGAEKVKNYALSGVGLGSLKLKGVTREAGSENRYRLLLKGIPGNGPVKILLKGITDQVGNPLAAAEITYVADRVRPTLAALPAANSLLRELEHIDLNFSEAVVGAEKPENYSVTGSAATDLRIQEIVRIDGARYRLSLAGSPGNGSISVAVLHVTDAAGNPLSGNILNYRSDVQKPELSVIPAPATALARLANVEVTFSKTVSGAADPANYLLEGDGVGSLSIKEVQKLKGSGYRLFLSGVPGNGKLLIRLRNMADAVGNPLQNDTVEYLADVAAPQFTPSLKPDSVVNSLAELGLKFSEQVLGADKLQNYILSGKGAAGLKLSGVEALGENRYKISLTGPLRNGRVELRLKNISDRAGNTLQGSMIAYRADVTPPELLQVFPAPNASLHDLSKIELQFSEPMAGADNPENYILTGEGKGSLAIQSAAALSGNRVQLAITGKPGEGKVVLELNHATDLAGNPLQAQVAQYRSDTRGPAFETDPAPDKIIAALRNIRIRFSEAVVGADKPENYRLTGTGVGSLRVNRVRPENGGVYTLEVLGEPLDGEVTLRILSVTDTAGNPLVSDGLTFRTDVTPPTYTLSPPGGKSLNKLEEIQIRFSEAVTGAERAGSYRLSGDGVGSLQIVAAHSLPQNNVRLSLQGKPGNGGIELHLKEIGDRAGNALSPERVAYHADSIAPSYEVFPRPGMVAREFGKIEISYSEAVLGAAELKNYALRGNGAGNLSIDQVTALPGNKYLLILKGTPASGEIELTIGDITDVAGNTIDRKAIVYSSDTVKPVLNALPNPGVTLNRLAKVTLRFSKPVVGAEVPGNYRLSGDGLGSLRVEKIISTEANEYQLVLSGTPGNGGVNIALANITDAAGNLPETQAIHYEADVKPVEVKVWPAVNSTVVSLSKLELEFSKPVEGADDANNYLLAGELAQTLRISGIENRGQNKYVLHLSGEIAGGSVQIMLRNIADRAGNPLRNNRLQYAVEIPTASQPCGDIAR